MKNLFLILFTFFFSQLFSQNIIEKYNEINNRYEYFDNNNNLLAYKSYNSTLQQWETFYVKRYDKNKKDENFDLLIETMKKKQKKYDANRQLVQNKIDELLQNFRKICLKTNNPTEEEYFIYKILTDRFIDRYVSKINNQNIDLSSDYVTNTTINYFIEGYNQVWNEFKQEMNSLKE